MHPIEIIDKQIDTVPEAKILVLCFKSYKMEILHEQSNQDIA